MTDRYADVRPIIVAESASTRFGGEAFLPLHYFRLLRRRGVEAWMVVHERTRGELEELLPDDRDRISFVPDAWVHLWAGRLGARLPKGVNEMTLGQISHGATQLVQRRILRDLVARVGATVVHEPTPVSPKAPSMTFDVGAPVVIGPMNGGMTFPPGFPGYEKSWEKGITKLVRGASGLANAVIPGKRKASVLLVANQRTRRALPPGACPRVIELVENGVDLSTFQATPARERSPRTRARFVFVGRLVDWKGVDFLLRALADASARVDMELDVVGDGVDRPKLEAMADRLGLRGRVAFRGFTPQAECAAILADADALVLPSLYDCGGAVVLEAMAMGLPVIATRWGGPADYLDETCGILIDPVNPDHFVAAIGAAMEKLARSPELARQLGAEGRRRIEAQFDWERKIDRIIEIYREAQREPLPAAAPMPGADAGAAPRVS
jgi:glycosyltransferase involved in cell wall biosynthesis